MRRPLLLALCLMLSSTASAIVIRADLDDAAYRVPASTFPALVDMPGEGHGVLIAPQWVVTAAHTIPLHGELKQVTLLGTPRPVERVVVHAGYRPLPPLLIEQAMASGEAMLIVAYLADSDDIALIQLAQPVTDVTPAERRGDSVRAGETVQLLGKGATGQGVAGYDPAGPHRTALRRAYNQVTSAYGRWFCYRFDAPPAAVALEGTLGNGDSGGPVLVQAQDQWQLAGVASWKVVQGNVITARYGRYGEVACNVRLSHYADWIDAVMAGEEPAAG
ncbi:trypsin-like serine protease [Stenotrophomonas sp.]|uniref:S1 family peptidase n=1 Tax=Stenotrophomonas sp. TaxID=69392 RepID=UPI002FCB27C9